MKVSLATPDRKIFEAESAQDIKLIAYDGEIEILPRHTNYIAIVQKGPVAIRVSGSEVKRFQVGEGVVKVEDDRVSILCKDATAA